ncbi:MAG: ATP-binding cassette domain-containing protein [Gaiellaceae bacterium MAG52_C11]|nr:ATP-binding cassette domain-containing protein [Candidatus Gaiellasilicea maunaloa]
MIEVRELSKRFGDALAVDRLSFDVRPGVVTGFLGPNGAGKSTTMRLILGLDEPTSGSVTVARRSYRDLPAPMQEVGALLDAKAIHGKRSAHQHLRWLAQAGGFPRQRVDEVLELVGLAAVAGRRVGGFSLGMQQRLGMAAALLGNPQTLLFDEPVNGLDPEGVLWVRNLFKGLAHEGRTILVSSHLMSEMEETAEHVLVIGRGRLLADLSIGEFTQRSSGSHVCVVSPEATRLTSLLLEQVGSAVTSNGDGGLSVAGIDTARIGDIAAEHGIRLHELTPQRASLEDAFMELTRESVEYRAQPAAEKIGR